MQNKRIRNFRSCRISFAEVGSDLRFVLEKWRCNKSLCQLLVSSAAGFQGYKLLPGLIC